MTNKFFLPKLLFLAFIALSSSLNAQSHNDHPYVDLALPSGTLWATCNIGATVPEEFGEYYAWGELTPKEMYTEVDYTFHDNPTELDTPNDIAAQSWGGSWKMASQANYQELLRECYWVWTSSYGTSKKYGGYIVFRAKNKSDKGKMQDKNGYASTEIYSAVKDPHIFLPAAGFKWHDDHRRVGAVGYYWTSTLDTYGDGDRLACYFNFGGEIVDIGYFHRNGGLSVRAVCEKSPN